MFKRLFSNKTVLTPEFEFRQARHMFNSSFHVERMNAVGERVILCGNENCMYGTRVITSEEVTASLPNQHESWHWCESCASQFTGLSVEEISKHSA